MVLFGLREKKFKSGSYHINSIVFHINFAIPKLTSYKFSNFFPNYTKMHKIDAHILISRIVSESRHILNTNKMNQCSWSIINLHAAIDHNRESLQQSIHINIFVWMPANPMQVIKSLLITYYFWKGNNFLLYFFLFKFQLQKRYWIYYQIVV